MGIMVHGKPDHQYKVWGLNWISKSSFAFVERHRTVPCISQVFMLHRKRWLRSDSTIWQSFVEKWSNSYSCWSFKTRVKVYCWCWPSRSRLGNGWGWTFSNTKKNLIDDNQAVLSNQCCFFYPKSQSLGNLTRNQGILRGVFFYTFFRLPVSDKQILIFWKNML